MEKEIDIVEWSPDQMLEVTINEPDDFLKVRETLTRIGVASRKEKKLFQSCHILHKQGRYFIVHFKELFMLDGKKANLESNDIARRNTIVTLLSDWGLVDLVKKEELEYDMENLIFTDCQLDENISNSSIDYETEPITHPNTLKQVYGSDLIPTIKRLKKEYRSFSREIISVGLREKYPQKSFSSKSDYSSNNFTTDILKYSVRDAETEETLIECDEYSKISCDSEGHFFNFDFSCLATGRVYKFLILLESEYGDFLHEDKRRFIVRV